METLARQLGHMTARMVCGFICVLLMSRFMFYCGFTCVLFMMSFRSVYDSLVFVFMLRIRCFMLVLYVFGLCKALSLRSGSYRRSPLGLPNIYCTYVYIYIYLSNHVKDNSGRLPSDSFFSYFQVWILSWCDCLLEGSCMYICICIYIYIYMCVCPYVDGPLCSSTDVA